MKVFISWSGEQSKQVALALRDWLPVVIQAVVPYMSEQDTHAGERWLQKVSTELDKTNFSIICVTRENVGSPWLNFEAGALSKAVDTATVVPLLYGFSSASDLAPPLGQFQAKLANEKGMRELITAIDSHIEHPLGPIALAKVFQKFWPDLEEQFNKIQAGAVLPNEPQRPDRELLEEILELVRIKDNLYDSRFAFLTELVAEFGRGRVTYYGETDVVHIDKTPQSIPDGLLQNIKNRAEKLGLQLVVQQSLG